MPDSSTLRPDLYIAAMGRSGSTALCNVLTEPPNHIVFHEPRFHRPPYRGLLQPQLAELGMELDDALIEQVAHLAPQAQLAILMGTALSDRKWGFKEVLCEEHRAVVDLFDPKHVLFCVRDIEDVAASFFEKHQQQDNEAQFPVDWVIDYCIRESAGLVEIHTELCASDTPVTIVRYEDLTGEATFLEELSEVLGWPVGGTTDRGMKAFNRGFEVARHGRRIGAGIDRTARSLSNARLSDARDIKERCSAYQRYFGYA